MRRSDAPSEHVARIGWLLLRLLHDRAIEYATYRDRFGRSSRGFQRDLCKLREIGRGHFTISRTKSGRALLAVSAGGLSALSVQSRNVTATLSRIAAALGGPVERELRSAIGDAPAGERTGFLHMREPLPSASDGVTRVFEFLKGAADGPARVEFAYVSRGAQTVRRVEPYHVVARSGRYYLIAYDLTRKDWRHFALDAMQERTLRKEGTFMPRPVPARFLADRAVGWIAGSSSTDVTVHVSALVAGAVRARRWQQEQRIVPQPDGSADITLTVEDPAEAVRWAMQFGPEAVVVAPPQAVALARDMVSQMAAAYDRRSQRRLTG